MTTSVWDDIDFDPTEDARQRAFVAAKVASTEHWTFLSGATDQADFENRLALISDQIDTKVASVAEGAEFAVVRAALDRSYAEDWTALQQHRQAEAQRRNAPRAARRSARRRFLKRGFTEGVDSSKIANAEDDALDVWFRFFEGDDGEESEESEAEANTYRDGDGFRVEWYLTSVGLVSERWFSTYEEASAWLESEGFRDFGPGFTARKHAVSKADGRKKSRRKRAEREDEKCVRCGKPATHYVFEEGYRASGYFVCNEDLDLVSQMPGPGRTVEKISHQKQTAWTPADEIPTDGYIDGLACPECDWTGTDLGARSEHIRAEHPGVSDFDPEIEFMKSRMEGRKRASGDTCAQCGHKEASHDVIAPSTDAWAVCYECGSGKGHRFQRQSTRKQATPATRALVSDESGDYAWSYDEQGDDVKVSLWREDYETFADPELLASTVVPGANQYVIDLRSLQEVAMKLLGQHSAGSHQRQSKSGAANGARCLSCGYNYTPTTYAGRERCPQCDSTDLVNPGMPTQQVAASKTAASDGWWPVTPPPNPDTSWPDESALRCPECNSASVTISGSNLGSDVVRGTEYTTLTCKDCGNSQYFPRSRTTASDGQDPTQRVGFAVQAARRHLAAGEPQFQTIESSKKIAGNPYEVGSPAWFRWESGEGDPASYGPKSGVPKDLFPDGVPLHGDLTPEQEKWLKSRSSKKAISDEYAQQQAWWDSMGPGGQEGYMRDTLGYDDDEVLMQQIEQEAAAEVNAMGLSGDEWSRAYADALLDRGVIRENGYSRFASLKQASRKQAGHPWEEHIGRGYVGFPGSEILEIIPHWDETERFQAGGWTGVVVVRTEDGRELRIPTTLDRLHTYDRSSTKQASRKRAGQPADSNSLNSMIEFDSPFQVHEDGTVTTYLPSVYSPSVNDWEGNTGKPEIEGSGWDFVDGFSGQYSYSGPVMHNSEFLGGGMAKHVLDHPGIYVVTAVWHSFDEEDEYGQTGEHEGWVLLEKTGSQRQPQASRKTADSFWDAIDAQIEQLKSAKTADDVMEILSQDKNPYGPGVSAAPAFFAGGGGDKTVQGALMNAGWHITWAEASYHYVMEAPDGSKITYVEGDVYKGDTAMKSSKKLAWSIDQIRQIVDKHQYDHIDGVLVDAFSASAMVAVYDALSSENQAKAESLPVATFANFAIKQAASKQAVIDSMDTLLRAQGADGEPEKKECPNCGSGQAYANTGYCPQCGKTSKRVQYDLWDGDVRISRHATLKGARVHARKLWNDHQVWAVVREAGNKGPMDRSVAFSVLLDLSPEFANSPVDGGAVVTKALDGFYASDSGDIYAFIKEWITTDEGRAAINSKVQGRKTAQGGRWYVHTHRIQSDGTKDSFLTRGFDTEAEAQAWIDEMKSDPYYSEDNTSIELQAPGTTAMGTNPYLPSDNPFAVTPASPGTPDDLLDGPYDPTVNDDTDNQPTSEIEDQAAAV